ncbi:MFS transporter [Candidatus Poribacteria bacterium]|nr:MFS transporter [Candidatus Poribacteria bacterium]
MNDHDRDKIFYGWWIVAAVFVIVFFGHGIAFYSFSVFIKPLEAHFGWSRTTISIGVVLWALLYGLSGPVVGVCMDKLGVRVVIAFSALVVGSCYVLLGSLNGLVMLYILMFFSGIGSAGVTTVPSQTIISNWFEKYRGRAMGIMMAGVGLGGLTMPPVSNAIITEFGWRTSFRVGGLLLLFMIVPLAALVVRARPSDMGLQPDGIRNDTGEEALSVQEKRESVGLSVKRSLGTSSFWMLFIAYMLQIFGVSGLTVHFVACVDDAGVSSQAASIFWGLAIGFSVVGRVVFGLLADRWNPRNLMALTNMFHGVAAAILLVFFLRMGIHSAASLLPFPLIYGLSMGGTSVLLPVLASRCFGLRNFSKLLGLLMSGFALGVVGGPLTAGRIFDTTGNYRLAFLIFAIVFVASGLAVLFVQPDRYMAEFSISTPERKEVCVSD